MQKEYGNNKMVLIFNNYDYMFNTFSGMIEDAIDSYEFYIELYKEYKNDFDIP